MTTATPHSTDLAIDGMTCASCVRRVERSLAGDDDGVAATVNFATGIARVEHDGSVDEAELVQRVERAGYGARPVDTHGDSGEGVDAHEHEHGVDPGLRRRLLVAIPLTIPIVLMMFVPALRFEGWELAALVLGTPVALWSAWPFHRTALIGARHRTSTMDTLISIGVLAAWGWSVASILRGHGHTDSYVEVAAVTTTFVLAGRVAEQRARRRAGDALRNLLDTAGREVTILDADGGERRGQASDLLVGDRFLVRPGELVATDGVVESGESSIDRALVTGESVPEPVRAGDEVLGATQNVDGRIVVRATRVGSETTIAQVARLVTDAQSGRARVQRLADAVSAVFVPIVLVIAALTLAGWLAFDIGTTAEAVSAAVAVLIVACPCALGLATPTALLVGSGRGAQLGIVIRGPEVLEQARRIDTIVLDKTGTITAGTFEVIDVVTAAATSRDEALRIAGALEAGSEHPIARAITHAARAAVGSDLPHADAFRNHAGRGVTATVEGREAAIGSARLLDQLDVTIPQALRDAGAPGATTVLVAWDGEARAALQLRDEPRADSAAAIASLRRLGLDVVLATGDGPDSAHAIAETVGIAQVHAGLLPADKDALVQQLQQQGRRVAMVGDGINDSPALARADLGIAIGTGADVAIEASDLTLVSPSLWAAVDAIRLSRATLGRIRRNLFWAFAYNVAAIPLAVAGLLEPIVAGAAMAASSVFVVGGSLLLRRFRPSPR